MNIIGYIDKDNDFIIHGVNVKDIEEFNEKYEGLKPFYSNDLINDDDYEFDLEEEFEF